MTDHTILTWDLRGLTHGVRQKMIQKPETMLVRPFVVCAVLRGVKFDKER